MKTIAELYPVPSKRESWRTRRTISDRNPEMSVAMGRTLAFFVQIGFPSFVKVAPSDIRISTLEKPQKGKPSRPILEIGPGQDPEDIDLFLQRQFPPNAANSELGADVLSAVHPAGISTETARVMMKDISDIEARMIQFLAPVENSTRVAWDELDTVAPHFNLSYVVRSMTGTQRPNIVQIVQPGFFANASRILLANTTEATIQAFFMWKAIKKLAPWVGAEVTNRFALRRGGEDLTSPFQTYSGNPDACITAIDRGPWTRRVLPPDISTLSWALGRFFVEKSYSPEMRNATTGVVRKLQQHLSEKIQNSTWLSERAKDISASRVDSVKLILGYTDAFVDPFFLRDRAALLATTLTDSNIGNAMAIARADTARIWTTLARDEYYKVFMGPTTVNAVYSPFTHEISVPAGQRRSLSRDTLPAYATYGSYGGVLAHELGHIVDGSSLTVEEWDNKTRDAMRDRQTCLTYQYGNFTFTGSKGTAINVRGGLTLFENTADQLSLPVSYAAWKDLQRNPETRDQGLPGLESFTTDQLFFLTCK